MLRIVILTKSIIGDEVDVTDVFFYSDLLWSALIHSKLRRNFQSANNKQADRYSNTDVDLHRLTHILRPIFLFFFGVRMV